MSKFLRFLRISWTVGCGVVCVVLVVLWVRTYWWEDCLHIPQGKNNRMIAVASFSGVLGIRVAHESYFHKYGHPWKLTTTAWRELPDHTVIGVYGKVEPERWTVEFNYWLLLLSSIVFAAAPWLRWRFSLRTLLIATTLIAIGLGSIIALSP
jgi:hypothetical protein